MELTTTVLTLDEAVKKYPNNFDIEEECFLPVGLGGDEDWVDWVPDYVVEMLDKSGTLRALVAADSAEWGEL